MNFHPRLGTRKTTVASKTVIVKLMTLNLGLLAWRACGRLGVSFAPHVEQRLAAAPEHLRRVSADVIALQEVYATSHRRFLQNALRDTHPYVCFSKTGQSILGSGLMVLSRYPVVQAEFLAWRGAPFLDNLVSEKGCLQVSVDIPGFGLLQLVNLHLSVGGTLRRSGKLDRNVRQLEEIEQVLAIARSFGPIAPILLGDFNCSPAVNQEVYAQITDAGYLDTFAAVAPSKAADAVTWDQTNLLNANGRHRTSPSQRIDHIFVHSSLGKSVVPTAGSIEFTKPVVTVGQSQSVTLSDHYGLSMRLALKMADVSPRTKLKPAQLASMKELAGVATD